MKITAPFWDANEKLIQGNLLRSGRYEQYLGACRKLLLVIQGPRRIQRLFELEVPEIFKGVVEIKAIAREAGYSPASRLRTFNAMLSGLLIEAVRCESGMPISPPRYRRGLTSGACPLPDPPSTQRLE